MIRFWEFCRDLYLIVRFYQFGSTGAARGRELERAVIGYCSGSQLNLLGRPGQVTSFGYSALSGLRHEIDSSVEGDDWAVNLELKSHSGEVPKEMVMVFNQKSLDFFLHRTRSADSAKPLYRVLASTSSLPPELTKFCYIWKIITIEPDLLPIPVLLYHIREGPFTETLEDPELSEAERVLPGNALPLESLFVYDEFLKSFKVRLSSIPTSSQLDESYDIHKKVSDDLLQAVETKCPSYFEEMADRIMVRNRISNSKASRKES